MAVAGYTESDLDITLKDNTLTISGRKEDEADASTYLHRGIASRAFERRFKLAGAYQGEERQPGEWAAAHRPGT